tara:strand:- start:3013 stop:3837 length:825 start_codon:yes stop_codon:yes gene_type:complete
MNDNISIEAIEVFYNDFKKLVNITYESSEYEIKSTCNIIRKLLIDNVNINNLWKKLGNENRIYLTNVTTENDFDKDYQNEIKVYIPFLNIIPNNIINHYLAINVDKFVKNGVAKIPKFPKLILERSKIGNYIKNRFIVNYHIITRKDIVEYIAYEQGYIHLNIDPKKIERIKSVKKLRFEQNVDSKTAFMYSATKLNSTGNEKEELIQLGKKHHFETLIILQIIKDITLSNDIVKLYNQSKDYLSENLKGFSHQENELTLNYNTHGTEKGENWV